MKELSAILVDDEPRARRVLSNLLEASYPQIKIIAECGDLVQAVNAIKARQPTVVFLDVKMPNYAGYEIVNFFDEIHFDVIFVTAYDEFAIRAFELCAIDYLVKPIDRNRLEEAIVKLTKKVSAENKLIEYQTLLETIRNKTSSKIIIPELGNRRIIDTNKIIAIEANGAYTSIILNTGGRITTSKNLKYYENALAHYKQFYRSHRSWMVNLEMVERFNRTENTLYLKEDIVAKISRSQYETFDNLFQNQWRHDL